MLSAALRRKSNRIFGFEVTQQRVMINLAFLCLSVPRVRSCLETRGYPVDGHF